MLDDLAALIERLRQIEGLAIERLDAPRGGAAHVMLADTDAPATAIAALREQLDDGAAIQYGPEPYAIDGAPGRLELFGTMPLPEPPGYGVEFMVRLRPEHMARVPHPTMRTPVSDELFVGVVAAVVFAVIA